MLRELFFALLSSSEATDVARLRIHKTAWQGYFESTLEVTYYGREGSHSTWSQSLKLSVTLRIPSEELIEVTWAVVRYGRRWRAISNMIDRLCHLRSTVLTIK